MSKKIRAILTGAATAAVFLAGVAAHAQSDPTDCKAERPPENSRDDALEVEPGESLSDELATLRLEIAATLANLRSDVLKWCFLFWIGPLAALTAILNLMLPR